MTMKIRLKLGTKILCMVLSIIMLFAIAAGIVFFKDMTDGLKKMATEKAKGDLSLSSRYIDDTIKGDWVIKQDKLYKGDTLINQNEELVDLLGKETGDTVTIFQGSTRVATNVMKDGQRAVGTDAAADVTETVLKNGETFYGEADVAGSSYQTAYLPLKDKNGTIIGMLYTGASQSILTSLTKSIFTQVSAVLAAVIILSAVLVTLFTRRINKRLNRLNLAFESAGNGDMTKDISDSSSDELADLSVSYNKMRLKLSSTIQTVQRSAEQLASSSEQLSAGAEETNQASEKITEAVQQIANRSDQQMTRISSSEEAMEQTAGDIQQMSVYASDIADKGHYAEQKAKMGGKEMANAQQQMNTIHQSIQKSEEMLQLLDGRSKQIDQIVSAITQIADQTNLLALNASIEAARAGEHGKGFAVVAEEVRKLAEESQKSTGQISEVIAEIQSDMKQSSLSIESVKTEAAEGVNMMQRIGLVFSDIVNAMEEISFGVNSLSASVQNILASAQEITASFTANTADIKESNSNTKQAASLAEEQFAAMEEITAASDTLSHLAGELNAIISQFNIR
ncbi:methyl-accepting chemotaxis protein [Bacillus nakamurai]|uniref:methyl-accepting chemotaxis protein n=1 Tax=Bacillus nakamurai TaxID=1793963 RepID=UPI00398F7C63